MDLREAVACDVDPLVHRVQQLRPRILADAVSVPSRGQVLPATCASIASECIALHTVAPPSS